MVAMENIDKILELLQKKNLTEAESQLLKEFAESDAEIRSFINIYGDLNSFLADSKHLHTDLLSSYILYEMGDDPENKLIPIIRNKIKKHIDECSNCREEYDLLVNDYNAVKEHISKTIKRDANQEYLSEKNSSFIPAFLRQSNFRYAFVTMIILIAGYLGLFSVSSVLTPYYERSIFSQGEDEFYTTRGRTSVLFQQGLNSIENGEYEKAIKFLNEDILENKNDKSIFYSYYIIGITYLKAAESDFIGLFKSFDKQDIELAISNLRESIDKNDSGDYDNLKLDSYYYIGRAYLLIDDNDSARSSFQKVITGKGKFTGESKELIGQMEKN